MRCAFARPGIGGVIGLAIVCATSRAEAGFGTPSRAIVESELETSRPPAPTDDGPALRYGRLEPRACEAELTRRGAPFVRVEPVRGVLDPLRLTGPLHGVAFHSTVPPTQRKSSPWEIIDCRLALALDDFARLLAAHDIIEVIHYSIYRPPSAAWPNDRIAPQHAGGLAIDAALFRKKDGTKLDVERDFHGQVGGRPCGPDASPSSDPCPEAAELREIVCDAAEAKVFNVTLTPDYNPAHYNHFHLEVAAGAKWFILR